jgi:Bacterial SH3 domain
MNSQTLRLIGIVASLVAAGALVAAAGCAPPAPVGIAPEQATIWALQTQAALQSTFTALTLTAAAGSQAGNVPPAPTLAAPAAPVARSYATPTHVPSEKGVYVKSDFVKAREGPDLRFAPYLDVPKGEPCAIEGTYHNWYLVRFADGKEGWVYSAWLFVPNSYQFDSVPELHFSDLPEAVQRGCKKYCP